MAKGKKPNIFIKGMKSDAAEGYQAKETYRYANNARLVNLSQSSPTGQFGDPDMDGGAAGALTPYPSDRMALNLNMEFNFAKTPSLGWPGTWNNGVDLFNNPSALFEGNIEIKIFTESGSGNQTDLGGNNIVNNSYVIEEVINETYFVNNFSNITDSNAFLASIINNSPNHPFQIYYTHINVDESVWNTEEDAVFWYAFNSLTPEDTITSIEVRINGSQILDGVMSAVNLLNYNIGPFDTAIPQSLTAQVLGQYSFSNYMVILGTFSGQSFDELFPEGLPPAEGWAQIGQAILQAFYEMFLGQDFVIKCKQEQDGQLYFFQENSLGLNVEMAGLGALFYYIGNLGFSDKKQLKIVGSEESSECRRIYFTDGTFPLRTMNVAKPKDFYQQYVNSPNFFNLFFDVKFSPVEITGYLPSGNLKNKSYSFMYRYISGDGRVSQFSPISNPCSVPATESGVEPYLLRGAYQEEVTEGKIITGRIDNLDSRYSRVEMLYTAYVDGVPEPNSYIFGKFPILQDSVSWELTGFEQAVEIDVLELSKKHSWDTCKALETKDNRLFCANLNNTAISIETDFDLFSYNCYNEPHVLSLGGINSDNSQGLTNPHLYSDFYHEENNVFTGKRVYKYIKGPGKFGDYFDAIANGEQWATPILPGGNAWQGQSFAQEDYDINTTPPDTKSGILGAQSRYFSTPMPNGEYEGVRVTYRVLDKAPPNMSIANEQATLVLDDNGELKPYTSMPVAQSRLSNFNGKSMDYTNPVYNSHFVGYRRDEIYRFGIVFYDKKGDPMFVKRLGDIRFPTHSSQYYLPVYSSDHEDMKGTGIVGMQQKWPYYYQTSRHHDDEGIHAGEQGLAPVTAPIDFGTNTNDDGMQNFNGLVDGKQMLGDELLGVESDNHPNGKNYKDTEHVGLHGCVLYPYFEVKLSRETTAKIGGYSIVRVARDENSRTILYTGLLDRANLHSPYGSTNSSSMNTNPLKGKLGASSFPLWTCTNQTSGFGDNSYDKNKYGFIANWEADGFSVMMREQSASTVYTIDSPDLNILNQGYSQRENDRFEIVESVFSYKNSNPVDDEIQSGTAGILLGFMDNGAGNGGTSGLFAGIINKNMFDEADYTTPWGEQVQVEQWEPNWRNAQDGANDFTELALGEDAGDSGTFNENAKGIYTKYYSKRIPGYPLKKLYAHRRENQSQYSDDFWDNEKGYIANYPFYPLNTPQNLNNGSTRVDGYSFLNGNLYFTNPMYGVGYNDNISQFPGNLSDYDYWPDEQAQLSDYLFYGICRTPRIQAAKLLECGQTMSSGEFGPNKDESEFINAMFFRQFYNQTDVDVVGPLDGDANIYNRYGVLQGHGKTLCLTTDWRVGALQIPSVRGLANHKKECIAGYNLGSVTNHSYSPEMSVVNVKREKNSSTMYGGSTLEDISLNTYMSLGHYSQTDSFMEVSAIQPTMHWGENGNHVFGGDTFVGLYDKKKSLKPNTSPFDGKPSDSNIDDGQAEKKQAVFLGYTLPIECNFNIDLRHGYFFNSYYDSIPKFVDDKHHYNTSYNTPDLTPISFATKNADMVEVENFPVTVAYSELKVSDDPLLDNYSVFPSSNIRDLEYPSGPITQLFTAKDTLIALQHSGVSILNVNPRVAIPSDNPEQAAIMAVTGTGTALERVDYLSQSYGCQHLHGHAIGKYGAYFYDDNNCRFLRVGGSGKGLAVESLGETKGMQSFFQSFKALKINDRPLFHDTNISGTGNGGISLGYDPEYNEVLLTLKAENRSAKTIVFNENVDGFSSFLSKTPCFYFNHKGRMYCIYDNVEREFDWGLWEGITDTENPAFPEMDTPDDDTGNTLVNNDFTIPVNPNVGVNTDFVSPFTQGMPSLLGQSKNKRRITKNVNLDRKTSAGADFFLAKKAGPDPGGPVGPVFPTVGPVFPTFGDPIGGGTSGPGFLEIDKPKPDDEIIIDNTSNETISTNDPSGEVNVKVDIYTPTGLDQIWLANGYENIGLSAGDALQLGVQKYLNFGGVDYYYYKPFEFEVVINDNPTVSKIFDSLSIGIQEESDVIKTINEFSSEFSNFNLLPNGQEIGYGFNRFTKFAFKGDSTIDWQYQMGGVYSGEWYNNFGYYKVKEGIHFVPVRNAGIIANETAGYINGSEERVRGRFATVKLTMQYGVDSSGENSLMNPLTLEQQQLAKNFNYSIFSVLPEFRISRI